MSTPNLPAVRLPAANGERVTADGLSLELPSSNKFSVSWPTDDRRTTTPPIPERTNHSFMEPDSGSSDGDSGNEHRESSEEPKDFIMNFTKPLRPRYTQTLQSPKLPQLSRALSMPVPSQLGYLRHPHKSNVSSPHSETISEHPPTPPDSSRLKELSVELADSVQMMIQTMLQISPPQLLDPAKEQFSACSLSVPTSSMSAMLTSMKNLNYISANMADLCTNFPQLQNDINEDMGGVSRVGTPGVVTDFDIGEMLQSVGDSLSGAAAHAGVDLVLYHEDDIGMRHVCVKGDESGISYALSHVIRQVLATTKPGDSIELGLLVGTLEQKTVATQPPPDNDHPSADADETLSCTIRISHKYNTTAPVVPTATDGDTPIQTRPLPSFSTLLLRHLLSQVGATLVSDLPPPKSFPDGRTCNFTLSLDPGSLSVLNTPMVNADGELSAAEPSVDQLTLFAEGLKGKRVTLYANAKGSFAQHLTSYLTAWGMDVTHVSPDGEVDGLPDIPSSSTDHIGDPPGSPSSPFSTPKATESLASSGTPFKNNPSFVFIDDDVEVLKDRLQVLRAEKPYQLSLRQRPPLAPHHRPRSTQQAARMTAGGLSGHPAIVVHFTSISNYKMIKDVIHSVITSHAGSATPLPEVMIIPKPAGPRRFLTALYTAVTKPVVDPFFSPIATSPSSPNIYPHGSFYHSYHVPVPSSPKLSSRPYRPGGSRSDSDRSTKSAKDFTEFVSPLQQHPPPTSPLAIPDNVEYFSEAAAKLGASPSSGLVIQSPDGQPAGIFFHPRGKTTRMPSAQTMERDKGQFNVLEQKRRNSRLSISNEPIIPKSLYSLHPATAAGTNATTASSKATPLIKSPTEAVGPSGATAITSGSAKTATSAAVKPGDPVATPLSSSPPQHRRSIPFETPRNPKPSPGSPRNEPPSSPPAPAAAILSRRTTPRRTTQEPHSESAPPPPTTALAAASRKAKAGADGNIVPPISVLIVDDNPINQTILSTFMKKKKIKYDLAKNGQEAVQKWRTGGFHLILMDIQMPVMDGIQATKEIRRLEQANAVAGYPPGTPSFDENGSSVHTPSDVSTDQKSSPYRSSVIIVALTASSLQSDRVAALAAGCNDFLTKPVSLVWLNSKIIEWGSIKALQMWADLRPEALTMSTEQAAHARNVAERLHVPTKGRVPTPSPSRESGIAAAAAALQKNTRPSPLSPVNGPYPPGSPSSASTTNSGQPAPSPRKSDNPPPTSFWGHLDASVAPSAKTLSESAKDLARGGRRSFSTPQASLTGIASSIHAQAPEIANKPCPPGEGYDKKHDNIPSRSNNDDDIL